MPMNTSSTGTPMQLLSMSHGVIIQQALYSAAKLGVADLLKDGPQSCSELARDLKVNESALYRVLRLLASQSVFEETSPRTLANTKLSQFLRSGVPGSVRSILIFRGSELFFGPFAEILYSVRTGKSARTEVFGMDGWEYLKQHPEQARMFDDAHDGYVRDHWANGGRGIRLRALGKHHGCWRRQWHSARIHPQEASQSAWCSGRPPACT